MEAVQVVTQTVVAAVLVVLAVAVQWAVAVVALVQLDKVMVALGL